MRHGRGSTWTKDNRGTTMVTVVVSFALLLIFVTAFYKVQKTSQSMMMNAKDMLVNNRDLVKAYYLDETTNRIEAGNIRISFSGDEGSFYIDTTLHRAEKEGLQGTVFYYESEEEEQENP